MIVQRFQYFLDTDKLETNGRTRQSSVCALKKWGFKRSSVLDVIAALKSIHPARETEALIYNIRSDIGLIEMWHPHFSGFNKAGKSGRKYVFIYVIAH